MQDTVKRGHLHNDEAMYVCVCVLYVCVCLSVLLFRSIIYTFCFEYRDVTEQDMGLIPKKSDFNST